MKLWRWFKGGFSHRAKALFLYRRGMLRAKRHDHALALLDYSAVIDMPEVPPDVKAMALYNRAVVYAADGDDVKATGDLRAILENDGTPVSVRAAARQKIVRMDRNHHRDVEERRFE